MDHEIQWFTPTQWCRFSVDVNYDGLIFQKHHWGGSTLTKDGFAYDRVGDCWL